MSTGFQGAGVAVPVPTAHLAYFSGTLDASGFAGTGQAGSALNVPAGGYGPPLMGTVLGLTATPFSATRIDLACAALHYATGYKWERSANGTTGWSQIADTADPAYSDTGRTTATQYFYRVRGYDLIGNGAYSAVGNATTP